MTKQCSACKEFLPLDNFTKSGTSAQNFRKGATERLSSRCKPCAAEYAREWRLKNPTYVRSRDRNEPKDKQEVLLRSFIKARISDAKRRSTKYNKAFDIDYDYMRSLYTGICVISKLPLHIEVGNLDVGSIDCIEPSKGYVKGNVQWLSWRVNRAKGEQSQDDFILMCKAVFEGATTISKESTLK